MSIATLVIVALVALGIAVREERRRRRVDAYDEDARRCSEQRRKQRALNAVNEPVGR